MESFSGKKTVRYEINGKRYDRIEDVPREYRALIEAAENDPGAAKSTTVTKVTTWINGDIPSGITGRPVDDHRERFLKETVLPNLHLMDPATQAEVLREVSGTEKKKKSPMQKAVLWALFYAALGLLIKFGYSYLKGLMTAASAGP